jgi:hypothetical protein
VTHATLGDDFIGELGHPTTGTFEHHTAIAYVGCLD